MHLALFASPILIHWPLHLCKISHEFPQNPLFLFSSVKFAASSKNNGNEGTHPGTGSAFSSGMDEVFINGQILPTPNLRRFTFEELKTATRNFRRDTVLGDGFGRVFKGWVDEKWDGHCCQEIEFTKFVGKERGRYFPFNTILVSQNS